MQEIVIRILTRLSSSIIQYRAKIALNDDSEHTKDIPFGSLYQDLLKKNDGKNLLTLLLHLDGVSVTRSTKLKMWLFSASIVELPPKLRSRRCNMVLISIWVAHVEPVSHLWLRRSVAHMEMMKHQSKSVFYY